MESEGIDVGRPHRPGGTQKWRNQEFLEFLEIRKSYLCTNHSKLLTSSLLS